jgi:translocation and assembly module TamA
VKPEQLKNPDNERYLGSGPVVKGFIKEKLEAKKIGKEKIERLFLVLKAQIEGTGYLPFGDLVLAGRLHMGSIVGANRGRIAPNRRFYAGGGGSVRGFNFQGVGPRDADGAPTGGNSVTEAAIEGRYRFQAFGNDLGVVAFVDAGDVDPGTTPRFDNLRVGVGVGVRYFTSFGPVRIDVAMPINRQEFDPKVAFYVSIGQAF